MSQHCTEGKATHDCVNPQVTLVGGTRSQKLHRLIRGQRLWNSLEDEFRRVLGTHPSLVGLVRVVLGWVVLGWVFGQALDLKSDSRAWVYLQLEPRLDSVDRECDGFCT